VLGLFAADRVDVLVNGIGRAHVPVGARPLHRRHQLIELAQLLRHNPRPPFADVPVQRQRLVLGQDINLAQPGVDAVGERDVDDAVMPAKRHCRFGPIAREWKQPLSCPASKQYSKCVSHSPSAPAFLFSLPVAPAPTGSATIRNRILCCDTFLQSPLNGGEYHTQMDLAAHHLNPSCCIEDVWIQVMKELVSG
jgi:hypothetical protein